MKDHRDILFKESQKFTQWWLWLLLIGLLALPIYGMVQQLILKQPWGSKPMSDWGLILFALGTLSFVYFFYYIQLKTWIHPDRITVSFPPFFRKKHFAVSDIATARVITYGFVGYGLRLSPKYGTVYNIKGDKGLALVMKNGKKFMIGTQHPRQVEDVLKHLLSRNVTIQ